MNDLVDLGLRKTIGGENRDRAEQENRDEAHRAPSYQTTNDHFRLRSSSLAMVKRCMLLVPS